MMYWKSNYRHMPLWKNENTHNIFQIDQSWHSRTPRGEPHQKNFRIRSTQPKKRLMQNSISLPKKKHSIWGKRPKTKSANLRQISLSWSMAPTLAQQNHPATEAAWQWAPSHQSSSQRKLHCTRVPRSEGLGQEGISLLACNRAKSH